MNIKQNVLGTAIAAIIAISPVMASNYTQSSTTANADFAAGLTLMREEEKIARDVYRVLYEVTGINTFANITQSEQRHMDAMGQQLSRFGIADPVVDDTTGAFTKPEFQTLFKELVEKGQGSSLDALHVGAYIEELDIQDLQKLIATTNDQQLSKVYDNLLRGSRNHLRAFVKQISSRGATYEAQLMAQNEVDAIVASAQERGQGGGQGMGHGKGQGHGNGQGKHGGMW